MAGFGNLPLYHYLVYKPSASIEENSYQMGIETAQLIFKNINEHETEEKGTPHHIHVPCKLVFHR